MENTNARTFFAPAGRLSKEEAQRLSIKLRESFLSSWFDAIPIPILVTNGYRQIVFCNLSFRHLADSHADADGIIGLRPGEALGCIHSDLMEDGCGTSRFCRHCGAAIAILSSLRGNDAVEECHIQRQAQLPGNTLDSQVYTSPVIFEGETFVLFCVIDISHEKRLEYVERRFFHDAINMVSAAEGVSRFSRSMPESAMSGILDALGDDARVFMDDLFYFKDIRAAEGGRLQVLSKPVDVAGLVDSVRRDLARTGDSSGKNIRTSVDAGINEIETDPRLLRHVLRNVVQNALEASPKDGTVAVSVSGTPEGLSISVNNEGCMDEAIQDCLFKRYFSTKGEGRGLGTYFARLFSEKYLGGSITFTSSQQDGTTFTISLPRSMPQSGT